MANTGTGKSTKQDRSRKSAQNLRYIAEQRHDKSHVRRLTKHCAMFPNERQGQEALVKYKAKLGMRNR